MPGFPGFISEMFQKQPFTGVLLNSKLRNISPTHRKMPAFEIFSVKLQA